MSQDDDLDFERAEFDESEDAQGTGEAPRTNSPGRIGCSACGNEIRDQYFTRDDAFICARCEGPVRAAGPPNSAVTRIAGALGLGVVAAILASALWMIVTEVTGYEIGLIAIAIGWIVGVAVTLGSRGSGGWPYQLIAVFLTYTAIVMTYVPMLVPEFEAEFERSNAELAIEATPSSGDPMAVFDLQAEQAKNAEAERLKIWLTAIVVSFAVPFLGGAENIIGLLIIGFGLYQAFNMTAKRENVWSGPFEVGRSD